MTNKFFRIALLLSMTLHSFFIFGLPDIILTKKLASHKDIEIAYLKLKNMDIIPARENIDQPVKNSIEDTASTKIEVLKPHRINVKYKKYLKKSKEKADKKIDPSFNHKIKRIAKRQAYIDYYQILRERIKLLATGNYPKDAAEGEIALTFTLFNDGRVKSIDIIESKSTADMQLRAAAVRSIKDASPFPAFPKELQNLHIKDLTFNILISFEVRK